MLLVLFPITEAALAHADDLVIQDNGQVDLVLTNNGNVLGVTTTAPVQPVVAPKTAAPGAQTTQSQPAPKPQTPPATPAPAKTVPITAPHTDSTVQINPPINDSKKMQIIITTPTNTTSTTPIPSSPVISSTPAKITPTTTPLGKTANPLVSITPSTHTSLILPTPTPALVLTKTVDQVVAQGSNGQPVITITSPGISTLTIQQGPTQVTTNLPLQIDTLTHVLSIPSQNQSSAITVLPKEALQGIVNTGLLNTQQSSAAKIDLTKDPSGINYTVNAQKQGKILGVIPVKSPVQITLSAQTGKIMHVVQPILFSILGSIIK